MNMLGPRPEAAPPVRPARDSVGDLLRRLVDEFIILVRSEMRLAGSEMRAKLGAALGSVAAIAVGALLLSLAMLCLLAAGIAALAQSVGFVWAALIVAGGALLVAGILIYTGVARLKATELAPARTVANLRRDAETLKGD